ncbi:uncharacterized protein LOC142321828 isoform X1 [Lycorma delicatula]|uniref:uncharacterized protein LOC142321828 isoform X1 n=1 Tax=Lycorma delicatula TaxID=130591 RepID=UPI003F519B52
MIFCFVEYIALILLISWEIDSSYAFGLFGGPSTKWTGFLGRFPTDTIHGFYKMPFNVIEALTSNPQYFNTEVTHPEFDLKIFCFHNDPHVCPMFDKNNNVAGLRISHLKHEVAEDDNLSQFPYKYDEIPIYTSMNFLGKDVWYADFLFAYPENLLPGGSGKINTNLVADGLWAKFGSKWIEIPKDECEIRKQGWVRQGFVPWMGLHYSLTRNENCAAFVPYLPFYDKGKLIGLSFAPFGRYNIAERNWFEDSPVGITKAVLPNGADVCLLDWCLKYRVASFHFYFIESPRRILKKHSAECK